jgi:hypothetical protein
MIRRSVLLVAVLVGCGPESAVPESAGTGTLVVEGTVRQVGSTPSAATRIETGDGPVVVVGPLAAEIARASGAVARIQGTDPGGGTADTIRAVNYELVSVDGLSPLVGILALEDGVVAVGTEDGRRVELVGASDRLRSAAGSKVWVTTRDDGRTVVRWGILRASEQ